MKYSILSLLLCLVVKVNAQTVKGCISNSKNKEEVAFATIQFPGLNKIVRSDIHGCFQVSIDTSIVHDVIIKASGYEVYEETVKFSGTIQFELIPMHLDIDEVVVSGHRNETQKNVVTHIDKVSVNKLNLIPSLNTSQLLEQINGVYSANLGGGITKPVIRGLQGNRVVTLLNGARIENQQWGRDHGSALTEVGVESVEIIKGPSSLMYGADALGGIIQFVDKSFLPNDEDELEVGMFAESNALLFGGYSEYRHANEKFKFNLGGRYAMSSDYAFANGDFVRNSRFQNYVLKGSLGWSGERHSNTIRFVFNSGRFGIPGHTHDSIVSLASFVKKDRSFRKLVPVQLNTLMLVQWKNKVNFQRSHLTSSIVVSGNVLEEFEGKITVPELSLTSGNVQPSIIYDYQLTEKLRWMNGLQTIFTVQKNAAFAEDELVPDASKIDAGIFSILNYDVQKWRFQVGGRMDQRLISSAKGDFDFFAWNYSLGGVRNGKKNTLHMNYSSGVRMPTLPELTSFGTHHGTMRFEIGNQNLKPEFGQQLDVAFDYGGDHLSVLVNPFYSTIDNFIQVAPTDSLIEGLQVYNYEAYDEVMMYGGEIGIHYHPHFLHALHVEPSFSLVQGEVRGESYLPLMPANRFKADVKWEFKEGKSVYFDNISIQYFHYLKQERVALNELPTSEYGLLNLSTKLIIGKEYKGELQFAIRNVTNKKYISHLSSLKFLGVQDPGRSIIFKFKYQLL